MNCFCLLANLVICATFFAGFAKSADCPKNYECPEAGSTESCMVEVCRNGRCKPKFHAGCFVRLNNGKLWTVYDAPDCAKLCDSDPGCKGFSFGKQMVLFDYIGCRLATDMKDCYNKDYYVQEPKNTSRGKIGNLMQDPEAPVKSYGYTGCYTKNME